MSGHDCGLHYGIILQLSRRRQQHRDVGQIGEDLFSLWCSTAGLTPSKSSPDRFGWDHLVEFEPELDDNLPRDGQHVAKKCFVQVKSTDKASHSVRAKLSALKHLVDTTLPAFLLFLEFNGVNVPARARLLHIGETEIASVLKAVRLAESKNDRRLHTIVHGIPLSGAVTLQPDGSDMADHLNRAISSDQSEYARWKSACRRTCGFDERSIEGRMIFSAADGEEALVDLSIGARKSLKADQLTITKRRFGISVPKDVTTIFDADVSITPSSSATARLRVRDADGRTRAETVADVFIPTIPGLKRSSLKFRISNYFIETILSNTGRQHISIAIPDNKKMTLRQLAKALSFGLELSRPGAHLELDLGDGKAITATLPQEVDQLASWQRLSDYGNLLADALAKYQPDVVIETTRFELEQSLADNGEMFDCLTQAFDLSFQLETNVLVQVPQTGTLVFPICIAFANFDYYAVLKAPVSQVIHSDGLIKMSVDNPTVLEDYIGERSDAELLAFNRRAKAYSKVSGNNPMVLTRLTVGKSELAVDRAASSPGASL